MGIAQIYTLVLSLASICISIITITKNRKREKVYKDILEAQERVLKGEVCNVTIDYE